MTHVCHCHGRIYCGDCFANELSIRMKRKRSELSVALRHWRHRHKLSQTKAALKLKVSPRTFQEWEQGRAMPHHLVVATLRDRIAR